MSRAKTPGGAPTPSDIARAHWGEPVPDWIEALALASEASSQAAVAALLGRSAAVVSQVLRAKYPGDLQTLEDLVRGRFLAGTVSCPALGELPAHECRGWIAKAKTFANNNALRVRMYRACRTCPRNTQGGET